VQDQVLYRFEALQYSYVIDADQDVFGVSDPRLHLYKLYATPTPKGYWCGWHKGGKHHFVRNDARKKYAHPTVEAALDGYIERKRAFVRHSRSRLKRAEAHLDLGLRSREGREDMQ
jgi:hypothetical protein